MYLIIFSPAPVSRFTSYSWSYGIPLKCGSFTWGDIHSLRERRLPLSLQPVLSNSSTARDEISCPVLLSMLGFDLTWACTLGDHICIYLVVSRRHCFLWSSTASGTATFAGPRVSNRQKLILFEEYI